MNINLISPTDNTILNSSGKQNGHRYTVRFKEDILIPAKSKIHLNFASLTRQSELSFFDDQTLIINIPLGISNVDDTGSYVFNNILPRRKLDATNTEQGSQNFDGDPTKLSAGNKIEVDIPKGFYTFERFYKTLTDGINKGLRVKSDGTTPTVSNNSNYRASEVFDANPNQQSQVLNAPDLSEGAVISMGILENTTFVTNNAFDFETVNLFDFEINAVHKAQASTLSTAGLTYAFIKNNANLLDTTATAGQTGAKVYDSYAMGVHNYRHTGLDDNTPLTSINIFKVTTAQSFDKMATDFASVAFGLGSQEVANGIQGTDGVYPLDDTVRTQGSTIHSNIYPIQQSFYQLDTADGSVKNTGSGATRKVPAGFITCVITAENDANGLGGGVPKLEIYTARRSFLGGDPDSPVGERANKMLIGNFRSINEHFFGGAGGTNPNRYFFQRLRRIDLGSKGFAGDEQISLGIQLYQKPSQNNGTKYQKTYYRVLNLTNPKYDLPISQQREIILYDSYGNSNNNFNTDFFYNNTTDIDYTTGATAQIRNNKVASQIGLTPMLWSNTQNHGFKSCSYRGVPRGTVDGVDYNAYPMTLYTQYFLSATQELAEMFNIANDLTKNKVSNTDPFNFIECNTGIVQDKTTYGEVSRGWRSRSYSIFLKGLPLQNYKNKSSQNQGGFAKQILANVPLPFKDSLNHYNIKTTGLYEPNTPIVSHLYNQDMIVNKFEIDIKQMSNDRDATEIEESIVNFTIVPPDDYEGNINAIAGFKKLPK